MADKAWQLAMFRKSFKKKLKFRLLRRHLGRLTNEKCLLITCGDNNGALNYYFREQGGNWTWADLQAKNIPDIEALLQEKVHRIDPENLMFEDGRFDCVITIDVHEHVAQPDRFDAELARIVKPGGRVIVTVPSGDKRKLANSIKSIVGMTKEKYGHVRDGYNTEELQRLLEKAELTPYRSSTYSRFFTEIVELIINFSYVFVLSKKNGKQEQDGAIAPSNEDDLRSVAKSYRIYSLVYPAFWLVSQLDWLLFFTKGYCVVVEARK